MSKKIITSILGLAGVGAIACGLGIVGTEIYKKGKSDGAVKTPIVQEEQDNYYNIYTLTNVGEDVQISRDENDKIKLTYNSQDYMYQGESLVNFSYGEGPTAMYCSEFGEVKLYHSEEELLYLVIETQTTESYLNQNFNLKSLSVYDKEMNLLGSLSDKLLTHLNLNETITFNDGRPSCTVVSKGSEEGWTDIIWSNGASNYTTPSVYLTDSINGVPATHVIDFGQSIILYINLDKVVYVRTTDLHTFGEIQTEYMLVDGVFTQYTSNMIEWNYSDFFEMAVTYCSTSERNIQFKPCTASDSSLPAISLLYNGVEYIVNSNNSNIYLLEYTFVNGDSTIIVRYDGSIVYTTIDGVETQETLIKSDNVNISDYAGTYTFTLTEAEYGVNATYTAVLDGFNGTFTIDELTHTATTQESFGLSNVENGGYSIWGKQFIYFGETGQFTILIGSDNNVYLTSVGDGRGLNLLGVKQ